jgi:hypothetical protein
MPQKNREDFLAYQKRYAEEHKKERRAYYDANLEKLQAYGREYGKRKRLEARKKRKDESKNLLD